MFILFQELTTNLTAHRLQSVKNESTKINYRNTDGNNILTVGKKEFSHADHQLKFKELWVNSIIWETKFKKCNFNFDLH